ncbi:hypothetical protein CBOM_06021 [Ceraceosorus bombacis]|uniref:NADAR domain-containing protein n=1 Tax=Ceraceosorus bombacis TaxID=401625 RepID=A0A0N7LAB9_9BASI|nr:hypothetical protein CBOM_06021 [Ceraceosorus bombacis]
MPHATIRSLKLFKKKAVDAVEDVGETIADVPEKGPTTEQAIQSEPAAPAAGGVVAASLASLPDPGAADAKQAHSHKHDLANHEGASISQQPTRTARDRDATLISERADPRSNQDDSKHESDGVALADASGDKPHSVNHNASPPAEAAQTESVERVEFFTKSGAHWWLSNSSPHPVVRDGITYKTAEHLFQSLKFLPHRPDIATRVRKAGSPSDAMLIARANVADARKGWIRQGINVAVMRETLLLKFTQHSSLRELLVQTGEAELVEANPSDAFWGSGAPEGSTAQGLGRNQLGKSLMRTRETLLSVAGIGIGSGALTV